MNRQRAALLAMAIAVTSTALFIWVREGIRHSFDILEWLFAFLVAGMWFGITAWAFWVFPVIRLCRADARIFRWRCFVPLYALVAVIHMRIMLSFSSLSDPDSLLAPVEVWDMEVVLPAATGALGASLFLLMTRRRAGAESA